MSYQVVARRYRPQTFVDVCGQEHVTRTLRNAILRDRIGHAYLFTGLRGTGKTSIARIFAKALNCSHAVDANPCNQCPQCRDITIGSSLAVREIDGASHNSVDNVRELIDTFRAMPPEGYRFKVYIIDEVHMLSTAAFNALLKSLEEPPPHTIFILATTELHKIPETVLSRCQKFDLRALTQGVVMDNLRAVAAQEKIIVSEAALDTLARFSGGSLRDAQSLLERVVAFADGEVTELSVSSVLGTVSRDILVRLASAILKRDPKEALVIRDDSSIADSILFVREFVQFWRDLLLFKIGAIEARHSQHFDGDLQELVSSSSLSDIQDLSEIARRGGDDTLRSFSPDAAIDAMIVRMATREPAEDLLKLIGSLGEVVVGGSKAEMHRPQPEPVQPVRDAKLDRPVQPETPPVSDAPDALHVLKALIGLVSPLLAEHLRRVTVQARGARGLLFRGPEFSIRSLERPDAKAQLEKALRQKFSQEGGSAVDDPALRWHLDFQVASEAAAESLHMIERKEGIETARREQEELLNHPFVRELQKVFPGSTIEGESS